MLRVYVERVDDFQGLGFGFQIVGCPFWGVPTSLEIYICAPHLSTSLLGGSWDLVTTCNVASDLAIVPALVLQL